MMALLSFLLETWQSVHLVRAGRSCRRVLRPAATVCGTLVLKAMPLKPSAGDRLLLHVDRLAVAVVRADVDGARRPGRADAVAGHVAVAGQHEDVVAQRLEVVGDVVAGDVALVVQAAASSCWPAAADGSRSSSGSTTNGRRCSSCSCWRGRSVVSPLRGTSPQTISSPSSKRTVLARRRLGVVMRVARGRWCPSSARFPSAGPARPSSSG